MSVSLLEAEYVCVSVNVSVCLLCSCDNCACVCALTQRSAVVSASSDQATFALMVRGLGTCAQRVAPANISAYAGVLDIFLNVLQCTLPRYRIANMHRAHKTHTHTDTHIPCINARKSTQNG